MVVVVIVVVMLILRTRGTRASDVTGVCLSQAERLTEDRTCPDSSEDNQMKTVCRVHTHSGTQASIKRKRKQLPVRQNGYKRRSDYCSTSSPMETRWW